MVVYNEDMNVPTVKVGETIKARQRRLREGWFEKYAPENQPGLDIGCGCDPLNETFRKFDIQFGDGDAELLEGVDDDFYQTVYASHILEHVVNPVAAVKRWYKAVKPGGHLIICVPHRDLYEMKKELPSRWNDDHKHFFLPDESEPPCTLSLKQVISEAIPDPDIQLFTVRDEDWSFKGDHPMGEFSIEAVIRKK